MSNTFGTTIASSASYSGRYTTSAVLILWLMARNAVAYSDGDGNDASDPGAYEQAIKWGEGDVDLYAGGPLTPTDDDYADLVEAAADGVVGAATVQKWATVLSAYHLYAKRGFNDEKTAGDFAKLRDDVIAEMTMFYEGRDLDGVTAPGDDDDEDPAGTLTMVRIDRGEDDSDDEYAQ